MYTIFQNDELTCNPTTSFSLKKNPVIYLLIRQTKSLKSAGRLEAQNSNELVFKLIQLTGQAFYDRLDKFLSPGLPTLIDW